MLRHLSKSRFSGIHVVFLLAFVFMGISLVGQAVTVRHTFEAGDTARSSEVNENFGVLADAITALETRVNVLEGENAALRDVQEKTNFLRVVTGTLNGVNGPHLLIEGANVHIRSGSGSSDDGGDRLRGLGNLVIGYNEVPRSLLAGERGGSHNLVLGHQNKFASFGGFVVGRGNTISGELATVTGGTNNTASGELSSISGGLTNVVSGRFSSVTGGVGNSAPGEGATVSGGSANRSAGFHSVVVGGLNNTAGDPEFPDAFAPFATIVGGEANTASGESAAILGGTQNQATGHVASVSGGKSNTASGEYASILGGQSNRGTGSGSAVVSGEGNLASGDLASVLGGIDNEAAAVDSTISGGLRGETRAAQSTIGGGVDQKTTKILEWRACDVICN